MRKKTMIMGAAFLAALTAIPATAQTDPPYRIRYLADLINDDDGGSYVVEEGVFDTTSQANEVINLLAHLAIAHRVDCACEDYRRNAFGANNLEERMMGMLDAYGYVSRLVPSSEVSSLPSFVGVLTPYLFLDGDGYNGSSSGNSWGGWGSSTTVLDPNNPRQYARVDHMGIFVDTRLSALVRSRIGQLMGGYVYEDPVSLCAFAALDRPTSDMLSWVIIRDLRKDWGAGLE